MERATELQKEIKALNRLGLKPNQAITYLTLVCLGPVTAKTLSKEMKVTRPDIYRVMTTLEKLELAERILSTPCKFRAVPIQEIIPSLMKRRMEETLELETVTKEICEKFTNRPKETLEENASQFTLLPDNSAKNKQVAAIRNTQSSVDAVTSREYTKDFIFAAIEGTTEALKRGVEFRIIINKRSEEEQALWKEPLQAKFTNFKVKYLIKPPKTLLSIYDKKIAWVNTCTKPWREKSQTLMTDNACVLSILQDYFDMLWLTSIGND